MVANLKVIVTLYSLWTWNERKFTLLSLGILFIQCYSYSKFLWIRYTVARLDSTDTWSGLGSRKGEGIEITPLKKALLLYCHICVLKTLHFSGDRQSSFSNCLKLITRLSHWITSIKWSEEQIVCTWAISFFTDITSSSKLKKPTSTGQ